MVFSKTYTFLSRLYSQGFLRNVDTLWEGIRPHLGDGVWPTRGPKFITSRPKPPSMPPGCFRPNTIDAISILSVKLLREAPTSVRTAVAADARAVREHRCHDKLTANKVKNGVESSRWDCPRDPGYGVRSVTLFKN